MSSCSNAGKGVIPHTAQKWTKSFLGVVYVHRVWELSPHKISCGLGGEVAIFVPSVGTLFAIG